MLDVTTPLASRPQSGKSSMIANNPQSWLDIAEDDLTFAQKLALPPDPH